VTHTLADNSSISAEREIAYFPDIPVLPKDSTINFVTPSFGAQIIPHFISAVFHPVSQ
jgi:hypothetical protein